VTKDVLLAVAALAAALGGVAGLAALLTLKSTKRKLLAEADKSEADAAKVLSDTAVALLEPARLQVKSLREDLATAEAKVTALSTQLDLARAEANQLREDLEAARRAAEIRVTEATRRVQALEQQLADAQHQLSNMSDGE
jgi:chromosome segregation ATPase